MGLLAFDYGYLLFVAPAVLFSLLCQGLVQKRFRHFARVPLGTPLTGAEAAKRVCRMGEARHTRVETGKGTLGDHYDPRRDTIRLSEQVYGYATVAAVSIAAHEGGHAVQYATGYPLVRLRSALIPVTQISSHLAMPLVVAGLLFTYDPLITLGILFFAVAAFFQLVTLPVEFHASGVALKSLKETGLLTPEELAGARQMLTAAALTYVAALATALAQLLRLLLLSQGRRRR